MQNDAPGSAPAIKIGPISLMIISPRGDVGLGLAVVHARRARDASQHLDLAARPANAHVASDRPGVVNMLACDGSVKVIKSSISTAAWWALGSRAAAEVLSSDSDLRQKGELVWEHRAWNESSNGRGPWRRGGARGCGRPVRRGQAVGGPGLAALAGRGAAAWGDGAQTLPDDCDAHQPGLAHWQVQRRLSQQLRLPPCPGRATPAAGRR